MVIALILIAILCLLVWNTYSFLAVTEKANGEFLIVEAWIPSYALRQSIAEFKNGNYRRMIATGAINKNTLGLETPTSDAAYAEARLRRFGMDTNLMTAVPCWVEHKDRTYHSALATKEWLSSQHIAVKSVDVVTVGPHARRSRLLFEKAFGNKVKIGIIAVPDRTYDSTRWWRSSEGVREVVGEAVAYIYARLFFRAN